MNKATITAIVMLAFAFYGLTRLTRKTIVPEPYRQYENGEKIIVVVLNPDGKPIRQLIETLDKHLEKHLTSMTTTEFDLICDSWCLDPTDRDVVQAYMACGWRMKIVFVEDSLAMDGKLEYHASKDKRLLGGMSYAS